MIPRTQLDAFNQFQFDCDTPKLLKEIADFSGARIYRPVWHIFQNLLAQVAVRATELHDPVLNALMLRMGMYDVKANERRELVKKCEEVYKEGGEE